ncbi:MAG TPA: exodeoxyribonuclease VII small subunit [Candidatus Saccharimonadales bacterium]|nr:exodeoxyribonuclease VII small subunit [Candidatus Saccharimonadales bacterium]
MSAAKSEPTKSDPDFGTKLTELEAITRWFESEEVDLNAALAKFERGMQLADELKQELGKIENRVEKIKAKFDAPPTEVAEPAEAPDNLSPDDGPTLF